MVRGASDAETVATFFDRRVAGAGLVRTRARQLWTWQLTVHERQPATGSGGGQRPLQ